MKKEIYSTKLKEQNKLGEMKDMCFLCGEDDSRLLEKHHWSGRANSDETVYLCLNHHRQQTLEQNKLAPKLRSKNANDEVKQLYMTITQMNLVKRICEMQLKSFGGMLNERNRNKSLLKIEI